MLRTLLAAGLFIAASAKIVNETVSHTYDGDAYENVAYYDDSLGDDLPSVLLFPTAAGIAQSEKFYAEFFAEHGFYAMAADVYGAGVRPTEREDQTSNATVLWEDPDIMRARANAALDVMLEQPLVGEDHGAVALGYCFGSDVAFELARSNSSAMRGVITFHGSSRGIQGLLGNGIEIPAQIWVQYHHGGEDFATVDIDVYNFQQVLKETGNEVWSTHVYSGADHGFTNPYSFAYQQRAAELSHDVVINMLDELYPNRTTTADRRSRAHLPQPSNWRAHQMLVNTVHDSNYVPHRR